MNTLLRIILVLWIVGFVAISCAPLLYDSAAIGVIGFLAGGILLVPWLVGLLILAVLVWLTTPSRRR